MKKLKFGVVVAAILCAIPCLGQDSVVEDETYVSDLIVQKSFGLPVVRQIQGGTKIIVSYEGNWTVEMQGAFEHACHIWEEALPTTLPIRVKAVLDEQTVTSSISKVSMKTKSDVCPYAMTRLFTWSQIKGAKFHELSGQSNSDLYTDAITPDMFSEPDFVICYYNKNGYVYNNCSFAIQPEYVSSDKYDFVTLVLRDLAKSFGLLWKNKNVSGGQFRINAENLFPYEKWVLDALGYTVSNPDGAQAYRNALKDSLVIGETNNYWTLYAPRTWDSDRSLNSFIPKANQKLSQLMSYDFGRGSVIRDISDDYTVRFFRDILYWKGEIAVGLDQTVGFSQSPLTTADVIPYKGSITIQPDGSRSSGQQVAFQENPEMGGEGLSLLSSATESQRSTIIKYHPNYRNEDTSLDETGWTVSLLKNDGTWDLVYDEPIYMPAKKFEVSTEQFNLHSNDYARDCDNHLRCRVTRCYRNPGYNRNTGESYYYVLDYTPPVVKMSKSAVLPFTEEDGYYRDVKIGLKNIEGVTRIIVAQSDEDDTLPFYYGVSDFGKGYFIATVDRELTSYFTVTAYNKNGNTKSETFVLPPLTPVNSLDLAFTVRKDYIDIASKSRKLREDAQYVSSYKIQSVLASQKRVEGSATAHLSSSMDGNRIDISSLPKGVYVLTVEDVKGGVHSVKFNRN